MVFIDLGCGPITSAVALAWHHLKEHPNNELDGLLIRYLGIDRSEAMLSHADQACHVGGLFHTNSSFEFTTPARALELVPRLIRHYRSAMNAKNLTVILNCSYFFASHLLHVGGLIAFISGLLKDQLANDNVCLIFQNPDSDGLNLKWERFKAGVSELRGVSRSSESIHFVDRMGQVRKIRLRHEFLLNSKWIASGNFIPF
jgi:hypothetical protein